MAPHSDLLDIDDLSEEAVVSALQTRLEAHHAFYTSAGTILIAINPYEWQPELYSRAVMSSYRDATKQDAEQLRLPPHLFQTAQQIDRALRRGPPGLSQMIIISGESGAGKTESTKIILSYLVDAAAPDLTTTGDMPGTSLRERILRVNPLLEAFGNAKTTRNDNSSRFGKLMELKFRRGGEVGEANIEGARIVNYLLEKTRLTRPPEGERNFHILYRLLCPATPHAGRKGKKQPKHHVSAEERPVAVLASLPLGQPEALDYLRQSDPWTSDEVTAETAAFHATAMSLEALGVPVAARHDLWTLLAAVALLGNLSFDRIESVGSEDGSQGCAPSNSNSLLVVSSLLGVAPADLEAAFCKRKLALRNQADILRPQSASQALETRDTVARALYNGIFEWLVQQANATIQSALSDDDASPLSSVGVLDIYGFESLSHNSLEQLLINYANERLQRLFNAHIFELEQAEYIREGIEFTEVSWRDNQPTLDLIDGRPKAGPGILIALDDATWRANNGMDADGNFVNQLHATFAGACGTSTGHTSYARPKLDSAHSFCVRHYAGEVRYDARGFVSKNSESLTPDVQDLIASSRHPWLMEHHSRFVLRSDASAAPSIAAPSHPLSPTNPKVAKAAASSQPLGVLEKRGSRLRQASVGEQFRWQLKELIATVDASAVLQQEGGTIAEAGAGAVTGCAYVRCIKPNADRAPWALDTAACAHQLRCAGMMEAVRIRRESFARRFSHETMWVTYRHLLRAASPSTVGSSAALRLRRGDGLEG